MARTTFLLNLLRNPLPILAMSLLLAGCATITAPTGTPPSAERQTGTLRTYRDAIDVGGRLSVQYRQNDKDQAVHGSFTWAQRPGQTVVTLLSPLGQTMATIEITPSLSTLTQAGQAPRTAADVDALAADALGWPLPVSGLRDWLQGFAVDADGGRFIATPRNTENSSVTTGDGWRIRYPSWQDDADMSARNHPKRIDLERSTARAGDVAMRIVIDTWQPR
ncbi:MAG: lolB [Herbaspirillum sp.]|nr:lolB [Herbaspirillum sp.]